MTHEKLVDVVKRLLARVLPTEEYAEWVKDLEAQEAHPEPEEKKPAIRREGG